MKLAGRTGRVWLVPRRAWPVMLASLGIAALVWVLQPPADAQGALRSALPGPSAHLERAPELVRLNLGRPPAPGSRTKVVVLSPTDENLARGPVSSSALGLSQRLAPPREPGAYQVSYEVVSVDGHVTSGRYWFWYAPHQSGSGSGLAAPGLLVLTMVVADLAVALLVRRRKTKKVALGAPQQRPAATPTPEAHGVPAQRSPHNHEGLSPPRSRPRPSSEPEPLSGRIQPHPHGRN